MMCIVSSEGVFGFRFRSFRFWDLDVGGLLNELFILGKVVVVFGRRGLDPGSRFGGN